MLKPVSHKNNCHILARDGDYLQLAGRHFEDELHHGADGEASGAGGVDLVPNGVAVHLKKTPPASQMSQRGNIRSAGRTGSFRRQSYPHASTRQPYKHGSD